MQFIIIIIIIITSSDTSPIETQSQMIGHGNTQRRITVGRTPSGRAISSSQRPLPDNTQHSQQTNFHAPGGIRTHNPSRRAAADLALGHWDRHDKLNEDFGKLEGSHLVRDFCSFAPSKLVHHDQVTTVFLQISSTLVL